MIGEDVSTGRSASLSRGSSLAVYSYHSNRVRFSAHLNHFEDLWIRIEASLKEMGLGEKERWQWYVAVFELVNNAISCGSNSDSSRKIVFT